VSLSKFSSSLQAGTITLLPGKRLNEGTAFAAVSGVNGNGFERPCRRAFFDDLNLPPGVFGPVLFLALARLAAICFSEDRLTEEVTIFSVQVSSLDGHQGHHRSLR
jgi:hypothetical protein